MNMDSETKVFQLRTRLCKKDDGLYEHGPYLIDTRMRTVQCETCGAELVAAAVLAELAAAEGRLIQRLENLKKKIRTAEARLITTCEHCLLPTRVVK